MKQNPLPEELWDVRAKGMSGFEYRWGGAHTVNIYQDGENVDVFTMGAEGEDNYSSVDTFLASVRDHERALVTS